jgi:predicted dehydrogenase
LHKEIAIEAALANKNILLEKPMAHTSGDCHDINKIANRAGIKLMIGHNMRFFRSSIVGKQIIASGEIGDIVLGRSTISKNWMTENRRPWHLDAKTGGGMLMTVGIHFIDVLSWLLNSQVESVRAQVSTAFHNQTSDDVGLLFLQFENGIAGTVTNIGYSTGVAEFVTEITCTKGILKIDHLGGVYIGKNEIWTLVSDSTVNYPEEAALYGEWKAYEKSITENEYCPVSGEYGEHMVSVIEAAKLSSVNRQEVNLADIKKH